MTKIHREIYGEGRPLVMIHGWAMHSGVWREFARQLAEHKQVICLDLPGHGRSDGVNSFTLPEIGAALLEAIPVPKFSLLGWSLGATVAIDMASRFPERVESLLLLAGNPKFVQCDDWPGVKFEVLDAFESLLSNDVRLTLMRFLALQVNGLPDGKRLLQLMKHAMQECEPPSVEVLRSGLDILERSDLRAALKHLRCPCSIVLGDRDKLVPIGCGLALKALKPEIDVHVLENAGHVPFLSHAPRLLDILRTIP
ncbi:MAG: pimeloyl-ACP methyl ester esterase BioH [Methylococcaceae bacterium]|nr:pimeloyl-ACP methyl ester esterase BioH [Methylococcaceae bacterium]